MPPRVIQVDPDRPDPAAIAEAALALRAGQLVAFPTETVYGLGANALDPVAVARIFAAKGRPAVNPIIVHVGDATAAQRLASSWSVETVRLAERYWPGPLTLVVARNSSVPDIVTAGGPTVGLRVPAHAVALALVRVAGVPIAAPSANRSLSLSPTLARHVLDSLGDAVDLVLDGGPTTEGLESTVVDVSETSPRLLRPGPIPPAQIAACLAISEELLVRPRPTDEPLRSPGQLHRHYAPRATLEVWPEPAAAARVGELRSKRHIVGWLRCATGGMATESFHDGLTTTLPIDARIYAAQFYAALHALDAAGCTTIIVSQPPDGETWLAIHDRLRRASAAH